MVEVDLHNFFQFYDEKNPNHVKAVLKHRWCPGGNDGWGRIFD